MSDGGYKPEGVCVTDFAGYSEAEGLSFVVPTVVIHPEPPLGAPQPPPEDAEEPAEPSSPHVGHKIAIGGSKDEDGPDLKAPAWVRGWRDGRWIRAR